MIFHPITNRPTQTNLTSHIQVENHITCWLCKYMQKQTTDHSYHGTVTGIQLEPFGMLFRTKIRKLSSKICSWIKTTLHQPPVPPSWQFVPSRKDYVSDQWSPPPRETWLIKTKALRLTRKRCKTLVSLLLSLSKRFQACKLFGQNTLISYEWVHPKPNFERTIRKRKKFKGMHLECAVLLT